MKMKESFLAVVLAGTAVAACDNAKPAPAAAPVAFRAPAAAAPAEDLDAACYSFANGGKLATRVPHVRALAWMFNDGVLTMDLHHADKDPEKIRTLGTIIIPQGPLGDVLYEQVLNGKPADLRDVQQLSDDISCLRIPHGARPLSQIGAPPPEQQAPQQKTPAPAPKGISI